MSKSGVVVRLRLTPYREAWELQKGVLAAVRDGLVPHTLLLLEHPPVYTLGRNSRPQNVLKQLRAEVVQVDRGGDVTFHGPGQLVGYPIFHLKSWGYGAADYVRRLERTLLEVLAALGISGERIPGRVGVWVGKAKIAAIGVRISRGVTSHGFALNVTTDLSYFDHIVPCGLADAGVTSVERELGSAVPMTDIEALTIAGFRDVFDLDLREIALAELLSAGHHP